MFSPGIIRKKEITPPNRTAYKSHSNRRKGITPPKRRIISPKIAVRKEITPPPKKKIRSPRPTDICFIQNQSPVNMKYEVFYKRKDQKPTWRYCKINDNSNIAPDLDMRSAASPNLQIPMKKQKEEKKPKKPQMRSTTKIIYEYLHDLTENEVTEDENQTPQLKDSQVFYNLTRKSPASSSCSVSSARRRTKGKSQFHNARKEVNSSESISGSSQLSKEDIDVFCFNYPKSSKDL
ncbi:unnamed protein product [Moneuplotes crassus]|uniref:Uncharacterized protein n=1 Tax=Euplotes crassus TaxID=5936 RepID=A0AAD1U457_EUPCR|nr:unnamed protein product [Moneuplotes crassus]